MTLEAPLRVSTGGVVSMIVTVRESIAPVFPCASILRYWRV